MNSRNDDRGVLDIEDRDVEDRGVLDDDRVAPDDDRGNTWCKKFVFSSRVFFFAVRVGYGYLCSQLFLIF